MSLNNIKIEFEEENNSSVAYDGGVMVGECHFARLKDNWVIVHTGVSKEDGGQGIGKRLVEEVINQAAIENVKIVPSCPFAKKLVLNNPEKYVNVL